MGCQSSKYSLPAKQAHKPSSCNSTLSSLDDSIHCMLTRDSQKYGVMPYRPRPDHPLLSDRTSCTRDSGIEDVDEEHQESESTVHEEHPTQDVMQDKMLLQRINTASTGHVAALSCQSATSAKAILVQ